MGSPDPTPNLESWFLVCNIILTQSEEESKRQNRGQQAIMSLDLSNPKSFYTKKTSTKKFFPNKKISDQKQITTKKISDPKIFRPQFFYDQDFFKPTNF